MNLNHQPHSPNTDAIGDAWGEVDRFFLINQSKLADPTQQTAAEEQLANKVQDWANAILDLAEIDKPAAEDFIRAALSEVKGYRDARRYNGAEFLVQRVESVQRVVENHSSEELWRFNPTNPNGFAGSRRWNPRSEGPCPLI